MLHDVTICLLKKKFTLFLPDTQFIKKEYKYHSLLDILCLEQTRAERYSCTATGKSRREKKSWCEDKRFCHLVRGQYGLYKNFKRDNLLNDIIIPERLICIKLMRKN